MYPQPTKLGKNIGTAWARASGAPLTAKHRVGGGHGRHWIEVGDRLCQQWGMKNVEQKMAEFAKFSETCRPKWNLMDNFLGQLVYCVQLFYVPPCIRLYSI